MVSPPLHRSGAAASTIVSTVRPHLTNRSPHHRQPTLEEVQSGIAEAPENALGIIEAANGRECAYGWHTKRYQTQYHPVEVERVVAVTEYVDRMVPHPVPDPEVERQLIKTQEELEALKNAFPRPKDDSADKAKDKHSQKALIAKLRDRMAKKDEQIKDLQAALLRNFGLAKDLSDQSCPEIVETKKDQMRLWQHKVVLLQEVMRHKEEYIQEITQSTIDQSTGVLKLQRETHEILQAERLENHAAWEHVQTLEKRAAVLEKEAVLVSSLRAKLRASEVAVEEMRQQLEDKDDVIDALEEQFRQTTYDEAANLTRDEVLVRMTQLRFKIGIKNAHALRQSGEIFALRQRVSALETEGIRLKEDSAEDRADAHKLRQKLDSTKAKLAAMRRDLLSSSAPVRPIVMPQPVYDDARRLMEAPSAPRTRPLTEQDIVAAFSLFDASLQGELPGWDMPLYLRCLGFTADDAFVGKLVANYRKHHGTLSLEEFRDVLLEVQNEYSPMKLSAESLLGHWQEASRRRVEASKLAKRKKSGMLEEDSESESEEAVHKNVTAVSIRAAPMGSGDIEAAFSLFDYEECGEIAAEVCGTLCHTLGLIRTTSDLEALNVIIAREFSGNLNLAEWTDLVQYCQGMQPNFVRRRVLEHKPPRETIYPKAFPKAGRVHPLSERETETSFRLFDVDKSGLLPGHQIPTYLACLGLVCSGPEFTAMLVTQYKADLTQKVGFSYFCRMVRFVQKHLEFFNPVPRPPRVRTRGSDAQEARREEPLAAPPQRNLSQGLRKDAKSTLAPPSRPNTAVYSPRTRRPGEYPPWMMPAAVPAQVGAGDKQEEEEEEVVVSAQAAGPQGLGVPAAEEQLESMRFKQKTEGNDFTAEAEKEKEKDSKALTQSMILETFNTYSRQFNCPQVMMMTGSRALALPHVALAVRSLGFVGVTKRFLEQIWPYDRKRDAVKQQGGGAGDELVLDEAEFVRLVYNIERYGTERDLSLARRPKRVNRHLAGGALRDDDVAWVFRLLDDDQKSFLTGKDFRTLLTLLGFTLQDEPEIQNVLVTYDACRPSRSSREHNIFELQDCLEVVGRLTAKPLSTLKDTNFSNSMATWLC